MAVFTDRVSLEVELSEVPDRGRHFVIAIPAWSTMLL
jgi:hypothetical protein